MIMVCGFQGHVSFVHNYDAAMQSMLLLPH